MQEYIKKILGSGNHPSHNNNNNNNNNNTVLIISNDQIKDIIKVVKSLEDSGLLFKGVRETIQNEAKEQRGGFLGVIRYTRCKFTRKYFSR